MGVIVRALVSQEQRVPRGLHSTRGFIRIAYRVRRRKTYSHVLEQARWFTRFLLLIVFGFFQVAAKPFQEPADSASVLTLHEAIAIAVSGARDMVRARADVLLVDVERARRLASVLPRIDLTLSAGGRFQGRPILEARPPKLCGVTGDFVCDSEEISSTDFKAGPFADLAQVNNSSAPFVTARIGGRQLIFDGGKWWVSLKRVNDIETERRAALKSIENNLRLQVTSHFYNLEKARQAVVAFQVQIQADEEQLQRAKDRLSDGRGTKSDVVTSERNLAEDRVTLARRRFSEGRQERALNLVLGRAPTIATRLVLPSHVLTSTAGIKPAEVSVAALNPERLVSTALKNRPELVRMRASLARMDKDIQIRSGDYWPRVSLGFQYDRFSRRPDRVFGDPTRNYNASVDLRLQWNLFAGLSTNAQVEDAEINRTKVVASLADLQRRIRGEVYDRAENLLLLAEVYRLESNALVSATEAVRLARELFQSGRRSVLELRDAEIRFTRAKLDAINARLDLEIARESLRRTVGAPVAQPALEAPDMRRGRSQ